MTAWEVYELVDPRTKATRYVGVTSMGLEARLRSHVNAPMVSTKAWIVSLAARGKKPIIRSLQVIDPSEGAHYLDVERTWIQKFIKSGKKLLNKAAIRGAPPERCPIVLLEAEIYLARGVAQRQAERALYANKRLEQLEERLRAMKETTPDERAAFTLARETLGAVEVTR
mgnify:FL=1